MLEPAASDEDGHWAPLSDLMAALMLIFMFIAILPRIDVVQSDVQCSNIYERLEDEFEDEFKDWDVELRPDLTIRFRNPELLFKFGKAELTPRFRGILASFWPRYLLISKAHAETDTVQEIQIEGHTSSEWVGSPEDAYIGNMKLSQDRARSTLQFVLELPLAIGLHDWAKPIITASGLSSSKTLALPDDPDKEDFEASKRVEFRLITIACQRAGVYGRTNE